MAHQHVNVAIHTPRAAFSVTAENCVSSGDNCATSSMMPASRALQSGDIRHSDAMTPAPT